MLVAVVGAGAVGLTSIKNCLEEGLEVVAFEKQSSVGGLWKYREDDQSITTVMEGTMTNFSKHRMGFTDWAFPEDAPLFPTAEWMLSFLESYAEHFNLLPKIMFETIVTAVDLAPSPAEGTRFVIKYRQSDDNSGNDNTITVDRLIVATGTTSQRNIPTIDGIEHFKGEVLHSSQFRTGAQFKDKNVLVVGSRSSAADSCSFLASGGAGDIYMSHRGGLQMIPRIWRGKPIDYLLTRRLARIQAAMESTFTYSSGWIHNQVINFVQRTSFKFKDEWGFYPSPDTRASVPTITDDLFSLLESGRVASVPEISSIQPDSTIILTNGQQLKSIDVVIFATGFISDPATVLGFSQEIIDRIQYDPKRPQDFPRYRYHLTLGLPELCLLNQFYAPAAATVISDIKSMWIAGVWSGNVNLPSREKMLKQSKNEAKWLDGLYKYGRVTPGTMPIETFYLLAVEAGCADDHCSWFSCTWEGWKWWWNNRALSHLIMDGPDVPASHRLRGRKKWEGAAEIIWRANGKTTTAASTA